MLAYTWGVCDGQVTRGLVEITFSNDYSNACPLPNTGLYYQSENQYFGIPVSCAGIAPDKLLADCPEVAANMKALVASTCAASIPKVCQQQYELNPPFSCVGNTYASPLTVLSLAFSNTNLFVSVLALVVAAALARLHKNYRPTQAELALANPPSDDKQAPEGSDVEMVAASTHKSGILMLDAKHWPPSPAPSLAGQVDRLEARHDAEILTLRAELAALRAQVARGVAPADPGGDGKIAGSSSSAQPSQAHGLSSGLSGSENPLLRLGGHPLAHEQRNGGPVAATDEIPRPAAGPVRDPMAAPARLPALSAQPV